MTDWISTSLDLLRSTVQDDGGWPYYASGGSAVEPTAMAVAALHAHQSDAPRVEAGLRFILAMQQPDGSLLPQAGQSQGTGLGMAAGIVLAAHPASRAAADRVADHALSWKPETAPRTEDISNDGSLIGFSWIPGVFSWVEPTAYGVLLMERTGRGDHPRTVEARRVLRDRAVPAGGWNYGNSIVLGSALEAVVMPTALVLLALGSDRKGREVTGGVKYLEQEAAAGGGHSPLSLGWMNLALRARNREGVSADHLGDALKSSPRIAVSPWHHAMALLAVAPLERIPFVVGGAS